MGIPGEEFFGLVELDEVSFALSAVLCYIISLVSHSQELFKAGKNIHNTYYTVIKAIVLFTGSHNCSGWEGP